MLRGRQSRRTPFLIGLLTGAVSLLPAFGCAASPSETKTAASGESFTLRVGESATIEGAALQVGFLEVAGDSRCPKGERCVWEGDAIVRVWLQSEAGARQTRELHTASREQDSAGGSAYDVRLLRLDPQPVAGKPIEQRDYVATLQVARASASARFP